MFQKKVPSYYPYIMVLMPELVRCIPIMKFYKDVYTSMIVSLSYQESGPEKLFLVLKRFNVKTKSLQAFLIVQSKVILMQLKKRYGKIYFISALASATSYLDQNIGQIIGTILELSMGVAQ
jgi:hypothetical protein